MNTFFTQLKKEAQKVRLSERERETMWHVLESAMHSASPVKSSIRIVPSPLIFFAPRLISAMAFVLILAIVGGGTAYAAEGSIPGDILYPIKLNVNEKVAAALATSPEARAGWHAEAAERRMKEAEALSARGTLTTNVKAELEADFDEHVAVVQEIVSLVESEDPAAAADISTRFGSSIAAHSAIIARLSEKGEDTESRRESGEFARSIKERGARLAMRGYSGLSIQASRGESGEIALRVSAPGSTTEVNAVVVLDTDEAVTMRLGKEAFTTLEEVRTRLKALKHRLPTSTSARVESQISSVGKKIEESGKQGVEQALKDATTLNVFLEAEEEYEGRSLLSPLELEAEDEADHEEDEERGGSE